LGEPVPAAFFPAKAEAVKLAPVKPTGRDYDALHAWMAEHPNHRRRRHRAPENRGIRV
jgi:hypothetical protein